MTIIVTLCVLLPSAYADDTELETQNSVGGEFENAEKYISYNPELDGMWIAFQRYLFGDNGYLGNSHSIFDIAPNGDVTALNGTKLDVMADIATLITNDYVRIFYSHIYNIDANFEQLFTALNFYTQELTVLHREAVNQTGYLQEIYNQFTNLDSSSGTFRFDIRNMRTSLMHLETFAVNIRTSIDAIYTRLQNWINAYTQVLTIFDGYLSIITDELQRPANSSMTIYDLISNINTYLQSMLEKVIRIDNVMLLLGQFLSQEVPVIENQLNLIYNAINGLDLSPEINIDGGNNNITVPQPIDYSSMLGSINANLQLIQGQLDRLMLLLAFENVQENLVGDFDWSGFKSDAQAIARAANNKFPFGAISSLRTMPTTNIFKGGTASFDDITIPFWFSGDHNWLSGNTVTLDMTFIRNARPIIQWALYALFAYALVVLSFKIGREYAS